MKVLILNAGSSSQKSCLYDFSAMDNLESPLSPLWEANIDWTNDLYSGGLLTAEANGKKLNSSVSQKDKTPAMATMLQSLTHGETAVLTQLSEIDVVGHRVVHGGKDYSQATLITEDVQKTIEKLIPLAPNHNPAHLEGINLIKQVMGDVPQVAVFDTAFHTTIPPVSKVYPLPYELYRRGIQRYGFHGISHQYVAQRTADILGEPLESLKMITCHLGNGCSITAVKDGKSANTSMGFTPLEGLMMGTRSGSIDPAIVIYLMTECGLDTDTINRILNKESGLLGVSEKSGDVRTILQEVAQGNNQAELALNMYIKRIQEVICSMLPSLGGLDVLVFTAGIGENAVFIREKICQGLGFLGLQLDETKNNQQCREENISTTTSSAKILVVPTKEDWAIALQVVKIMNEHL